MKKMLFLISSLMLIVGLTAYSYTSINNQPEVKTKCQKASIRTPPILNYGISTYCNNKVSKQQLRTAQSIVEIIPDYAFQMKLNNGELSMRDFSIGEGQIGSAAIHRIATTGVGNHLNTAQWQLLKSMDYSKILSVEGYYTDSKSSGDEVNDRYFNYCMSLVPENEAVYVDGKNAILDYLKSNSQLLGEGYVQGTLLDIGH